MNELESVICELMIAVGFFALGGLVFVVRASRWRIEWIKLEHDLARLEGREPRNIDVFEKEQKEAAHAKS